jgi:hypothetical protein
MSDFDPYHIWLGIPETARPVSKYRLLAIEDFEVNREVISAAAEQRTIYLRTLQAGEHAVLVAELLNEVSRARVTLLNADQKAGYDEELRKQQRPEPEAVTQESPVSIVPTVKNPHSKVQKEIWKQPAVIGVSVVGVIGVFVLVISMMSSGDADPVASNSPPVVTSPPLPIAEPVPVPKLKPTPQRVVSEGRNNTVGYVTKPTPKSEPESVPATKPKVTPQKGFRNNAKGYAPKPTPQPEPEPERQPEPAMKRLEALRAILSGREALAKRDFDSVAESLTRVESFALSTDLKGPYDRLKMMHKLVKNFDLKLRETLENLKPGNIIVLKEKPVEIKSIDPVEVLLENNGKSISYPRNDLPHDLILGLIEGSFQSQTHDDFFGFAAYIGTMKSEYKNDALNIWGLVSKQDNHYEPDALSIYLIDDSRLSITDVEPEPVAFFDLSDVVVPCNVKNSGQLLDIDTHDNLSISIWVQPRDIRGRQVLLAKESVRPVKEGGYPCYRLELKSGVPQVTINDQQYNQTSFIAKGPLVDLVDTGINGWHHLCFVIDKHSPEKSLLFIDGGIKQLYVKNDRQDPIHTVGSLQNDGDLYLGSKYNGTEGGHHLFQGKLALTKLYRTKLTERQVKSIVSAERTLFNK